MMTVQSAEYQEGTFGSFLSQKTHKEGEIIAQIGGSAKDGKIHWGGSYTGKKVEEFHAERTAFDTFSKVEQGYDTYHIEQNAFPCSKCYQYFCLVTGKTQVKVIFTVTGDKGSYSMEYYLNPGKLPYPCEIKFEAGACSVKKSYGEYYPFKLQ